MSSDVESETVSPDREDLQERVQWLENRLEGARENAKRAIQRNNELEERLDRRDQRIAEELAELRERTRLLQAVTQATALKKDQRVAVLLQTLQNKALRRQQSSADEPAIATADWNDYTNALGGDVDRTYFYRDAEAAEQLVDDIDVLRFEKEGRGSRKNTRLILDLTKGDLPSLVAGGTVGLDGNQWRA